VSVNVTSPGQISGQSGGTGQGTANFTVPANQTSTPIAFRATVSTYTSQGAVMIPMIQDPQTVVAPFSDVAPGHLFFNYISLLKARNVSRGCVFDGSRYCPSEAMTRGEMASFLYRAATLSNQYGSNNVPPFFEDVPPSHPAFTAIQALRMAGITKGCSVTPARFCPDDPVTRGQMAAFIVRAKLGNDTFASTPTAYFTDVPSGHLFFKYVQMLKEYGITAGCGAQTFCPDAPNTRGEMSVFVVRAFLSQ
jgi:hypothetical protein